MQFIGNEEGRARPKDNGFVFDYFIKDHLGNTRMVLTDEQQTDAYPVASMETANAASEKLYYTNIDETRSDKPAGYPDDTYTNPNDKVARLNGNSKKIGPAILLKVMSGDQMNIRANAYYRLNGASAGTPSNPASELLAALANSIQGATGGKFGIQQVQSSGVLGPGINDLLQRQTDQYTGSTRPKAFLNWILLDEQFKIVNSSSGFEPVGGDGEFKTFIKTGLPISQNGYLYVYTSNESPVDVFFDNLQVSHIRGPLLEETHYYPFGLTMAGISSKAAVKLDNKYKYTDKEEQRKEFSDGSGLEMYDFSTRFYDAQIGRFISQDPHAENYYDHSAFNYVANNPVIYIDPDGRDYRLNIYQDKKGNWHMDISSTVHVFSDKGNAKQKVIEYNKFIKDNASKFNGTFTTEDGKSVSLSIKINYVEGKKDSDGNVERFAEGDNQLSLKASVKRHSTMGAMGVNEANGTVGNLVVMDSENDYYSSAATVHHDILHQIGLGDRYSEPNKNGEVKVLEGYQRDIMGFGPRTAYQGKGFEFNQIHFNNFGRTHFQAKASKKVSNLRIDKATIKNPRG